MLLYDLKKFAGPILQATRRKVVRKSVTDARYANTLAFEKL